MRKIIPLHFRQARMVKNDTHELAGLDLLKYFGIFITLLGTLSWIAGRAYIYGYWSASGLSSPPSSLTIQEVAFIGFINPIRNWMILVALLAIFGLYVLILGVNLKKPRRQRSRGLILTWIRDRFEYDKSIGKIGGWLCIISFFLGIVIFPLVVWTAGAYSQGVKSFKDQYCKYNANNHVETKIITADGSISTGILIDSSNKQLVLLNEKGFLFFVGDQPKLVSLTSPIKNYCGK